MSNPLPPGQQWDPSGQTEQGGWRPGWPEPLADPQADSQVTWSGPAPQGDWEAPTQIGWDQSTPQNGWNAADPVYETPYSADWQGGQQPEASTWVPGPSQEDEDGWPTGPAPEAGAHRHYQTSAHTQSYRAIRVLAQLACVALIIGGLSVTENGVRGWSDVTAWAFFAATAAVVQAAPLVGSAFGVDTATSWLVGAVGAGSLVLYWVLIVLPSVSTNVGFAQTMGVAAAVIGSWLSPGRQL